MSFTDNKGDKVQERCSNSLLFPLLELSGLFLLLNDTCLESAEREHGYLIQKGFRE